MQDYIKYLKKIEYPEYAEQGDNNRKTNLSLLDLSFDDGRKIDAKVLRIIQQKQASASKYLFSQNKELISLISEYLGVGKRNILITAGADSGLNITFRAFLRGGKRVCIPLPSFGRYEYHAKVNQAQTVFVPTGAFPYDLDFDKIARVYSKKKCDVLVIANPNNPTGICKSISEVGELLKIVRGYVILDEALADYVGKTAAKLVREYPRLVVLRSFSKMFGLAGMRIGYLVADNKLVEALRALVSPFEVGSLGIYLAIEALRDRRYYRRQVKDIKGSLRLIQSFRSNWYKATPSSCPTLLIESSKRENLFRELLGKGLKTVSCKNFRGLESQNCVRVALKDSASTSKLLQALD